jgi:hypothetical protein
MKLVVRIERSITFIQIHITQWYKELQKYPWPKYKNLHVYLANHVKNEISYPTLSAHFTLTPVLAPLLPLLLPNSQMCLPPPLDFSSATSP